MGSVDRHAHPDQPDPPGRPDAAREQPKPPRETEAQLAERLGLSTLTRASAYEALRERLAHEERETSAESPEPLTESPDAPAPSIDKPERDPEAPRTYWTEIPGFLANWRDHLERWPWVQRLGVCGPMTPEKRAEAAESVKELSKAESPISNNIKTIEANNAKTGWLIGFEFRLKGRDRLMDKVAERLAAESDRTPHDVVRGIPDAIRYTFCFKGGDYSDGYLDVKQRLEECGYKMYHCKNWWSSPEYKGVNTRWITSGGQRFEVQFHTRESFHAKHEVTHQAYERARSPFTSRVELADTEKFQMKVSSWIPVPPGLAKIKDYRGEST